MILYVTNDPEGALRGAIRDPFVWDQVEGSPPIRVWFKHLVEHERLVTLQPKAFQGPQSSDRLSTFPLATMIASIQRDDELDDYGMPAGGVVGRNQCKRLSDLAEERWRSVACNSWQAGDRLSQARLSSGVQDQITDYDEDGGATGGESPYCWIGYELCMLIDAREEAATAEERSTVQDDINEFLESLAAKRKRGGAGEGLTDKRLVPLYEAWRSFLESFDSPLPDEISDSTSELLSGLGCTSAGQQIWWSRRLALPMLTDPELQGLLLADSGESVPSECSATITRRRFAIYLLAHRMDFKPESLARQLVGAGEAEEFKCLRLTPIQGQLS